MRSRKFNRRQKVQSDTQIWLCIFCPWLNFEYRLHSHVIILTVQKRNLTFTVGIAHGSYSVRSRKSIPRQKYRFQFSVFECINCIAQKPSVITITVKETKSFEVHCRYNRMKRQPAKTLPSVSFHMDGSPHGIAYSGRKEPARGLQ